MLSSPLGYFLVFVAAAVPGLAVTGIAATRPKAVWLLLIAVSIIASGMMPGGYTIVDEYLTACLLLGVFMSVAIGFRSSAPIDADGQGRLHRFFFSLMIMYMIFQSIHGLVELESLRKIRWVVFYGMIGLLAIVLHTRRFAPPSRRQVVLTVTLSTLVYFTAYMLHGLMAELFSGISRWDLQTVWWGSTAYSMLPITVAMPAIIFSLKDRSKWYRRAGWSTLLVAITAAFYYDSRVALLSILGFFIVASPILGVRRLAGALLSFTVVLYVFLFFMWPSSRDLKFFAGDLFMSGSALWQRQEQPGLARDIDRWIHMQVAFSSIGHDWQTLLFGHGFRASGRVISPHLRALYKEHLPGSAARVKDDQSTEGFTALVVDTGLVGLLLHVANFFLVTWQVLREKMNEYRFVLLMSLLILFLWLFVINLLDITLFYLAIMPSGLILLMACPTSRPCRAPLSAVASTG